MKHLLPCIAFLLLAPVGLAMLQEQRELPGVRLLGGDLLESFRPVGEADAGGPAQPDLAQPDLAQPDLAQPGRELPGWELRDGVLRSAAGARDLISREELADVHISLEFRLEEGTDTGLFLGDRWEIVLADTAGEPLGTGSSGALRGQVAPALDAALASGSWQRLDVAYSHRGGEDPLATVWLNDRKLHDRLPLREPTAGGSRVPIAGSPAASGALHATRPGEEAPDLGEPFTISARFRSRGPGTLVSKCPPRGRWVPDAKALFLRGGRLVYDIGWVGALTSERTFDDGEWHRVVLTSDRRGTARLFVDGEEEGEVEDFQAEDEPGFVLKIGAASDDFGGDYEGEVSDVRILSRALSTRSALAVSGELDEAPDWDALQWDSQAEHPRHVPADGEPVPAPLRLRADPGLGIRGLELRPLGEVDHAGLIESWDEGSYARGEAIYGGLCIACHGADGRRPTNPKARPFATGELRNGADPLSLFETITSGYEEMPGNAWLRPDQRYDVIHYLRERFLRGSNPSQFVAVDDAYLNALPKGLSRQPEQEALELVQRDHGPALGSQLGDSVGAALSIRLDEDASIAYDLQRMASPAAWTGGFLELEDTQHHQQRGEGKARPAGSPIEGLGELVWLHDPELERSHPRPNPRAPLADELLHYHGYHVHGEQVVLDYSVDGRHVLETPGIDRSSGLPVFTHRLRVEAGPRVALRLKAASNGGGVRLETARPLGGGDELSFAVWQPEGADEFLAACLLPLAGEAHLGGIGDGELRVEVPASEGPGEYWLLRLAGEGQEQLEGFRTLLAGLTERELPPSPGTLVGGGPLLWPDVLVTAGELGEPEGSYALDTLTLPAANPWDAWLRTTALDFFSDGRAAVSTYGGDVWVVSGIDEELAELRWKRFAAGLFEPMGLRIVDDMVYVTCRDRLVRLHDVDGNGEADFIESFFPDPDVSTGFHSFAFDLQTDGEGRFYYAKAGQYTDYDRGGAILQVSPQGDSWSEYALGLRTPNGMGMSPDGRPLVSDNQGNWIPASKVSLPGRGDFMGVFPSIRHNGPGLRTRRDFDLPVLWMPQWFDSSSGGQLFVEDERFGPLAGRYLHTSFGKGWMYPMVVDRDAPVPQAAAWRLPFQFAAGIQRLRVNPRDGQVYAVGLSGWQGPSGGADGCLQRVRYTGEPSPMLLAGRVTAEGVELDFSAPLDRERAEDTDSFELRRWNYRWQRGYGSAHYLPGEPEEPGEEEVRLRGVRLSEDRMRVSLALDSHVTCDNLLVELALTAGGEELEEEVLFTVNSIPGDPPQLRERAECEEEVGLPWLSIEGGEGPGSGKHVVLIAGDEEYRSEECLPALAAILSERHGFRCTVLFSIDPGSGEIDPMNQEFTPGLHQLADADLVVLFTRFREWPDADMRHFVDYVESGRPLLGIRTATHAFDYEGGADSSPYGHYTWRNGRWVGGFGKQVLGETWVAHHGGHGSQASRGIVEPGQEQHPILRGLAHVFCPTDVYTVRELPLDAVVLLRGQVVDGMDPEDPGVDGPRNDPMMPVVWTRERPLEGGGVQRVVASTIGGSQGFESEGLRRVWVNSCFWLLGLEVPGETDVELVGEYEATPFGHGRFTRGVRPAELAPRR